MYLYLVCYIYLAQDVPLQIELFLRFKTYLLLSQIECISHSLVLNWKSFSLGSNRLVLVWSHRHHLQLCPAKYRSDSKQFSFLFHAELLLNLYEGLITQKRLQDRLFFRRLIRSCSLDRTSKSICQPINMPLVLAQLYFTFMLFDGLPITFH